MNEHEYRSWLHAVVQDKHNKRHEYKALLREWQELQSLIRYEDEHPDIVYAL